MSKWIDADALRAVYEPHIDKGRRVPVENILAWIDEVPSMDIVKCRDCVNCTASVGEQGDVLWKCNIHYYLVLPDDFCNYGERKDEPTPQEYEKWLFKEPSCTHEVNDEHCEYCKCYDGEQCNEASTDCLWK